MSREASAKGPKKRNEHHGTRDAPRDAVTFEPQRPEHRAFARSREMANCLRKELLYSEKTPRDAWFGAIQGLLAEQQQTGEHRILSRLTREAAARAEREARGATAGRWGMTSRTAGNAVS